MAAFQRISLDDLKAAGGLEQMRLRAEYPRPALRSISQAGVTQTRRRFQQGVDPDGRSWKPSRKPSGQTLIWKGLLLRSISARPPSGDSVEWGTNLRYAGVHQFGATIVPKNAHALTFRIGGNGGWVSAKKVEIPARPYLGINDQDLAAFAKIYLRHLAGPATGEASA